MPGLTARSSEVFANDGGAFVDVAMLVDADDAEHSTQAFAVHAIRIRFVVGSSVMVDVTADDKTVVVITDEAAPFKPRSWGIAMRLPATKAPPAYSVIETDMVRYPGLSATPLAAERLRRDAGCGLASGSELISGFG